MMPLKYFFEQFFRKNFFVCTKCGSIVAWKQGRAIPIHPWFFPLFFVPFFVLLRAK